MTTILYSHADAAAHVTPTGHPEQVARIEAVWEALADPAFDALDRREAPLANDTALLRCHPQAHIDAVARAVASAADAEGSVALDPDTHAMAASDRAARRAVGGAVAAVDAVMDGVAINAFVAMRPPGHHAEAMRPMGFCLYGTVAVAARHALDARGAARVAVIDFDVHHGNGTQALLWDEPRATFVSTHQYPFYPGTGAAHERGAHGQIVNVPLAAGTDGAGYRMAFDAKVAPAVAAAKPDLILVSAGFDAHRADPLAMLDLGTRDFAWIAERICDLAEASCGGRVVSVLEGGYDLAALPDSVAAYLDVMRRRASQTGDEP
jgi:acetoin utilization deacetylase AcuC-like enzyme